MDLGNEMASGSVVGCVEHIISKVVFDRFHLFMYLINWMISIPILDVFLIASRAPRAHFFSSVRVLGVGLEIYDFLQMP